MCGIVGFQGEFSAELLGAMTDAVAHRGPDGEGTVVLDRSPISPRPASATGAWPSSTCPRRDVSP